MNGQDYSVKQWHENLWTVATPFKLFGIAFGNRMTVVKTGGHLVLHSPVKYSEALAKDIRSLGEVNYLISPNTMHYLHIKAWKEALPRAKVIAPPQQRKIPVDKVLDGRVDRALEQQWREELGVIPVQGIPKLSEYAFIHRPSRSLILTDLVFNVHGPMNGISRFFFKAYGAYERFGPTRLIQMMVKAPDQFRDSLLKIGQLDFDRIIMSHGRVLETGGQEAFKKAFEIFLDEALVS